MLWQPFYNVVPLQQDELQREAARWSNTQLLPNGTTANKDNINLLNCLSNIYVIENISPLPFSAIHIDSLPLALFTSSLYLLNSRFRLFLLPVYELWFVT